MASVTVGVERLSSTVVLVGGAIFEVSFSSDVNGKLFEVGVPLILSPEVMDVMVPLEVALTPSPGVTEIGGASSGGADSITGNDGCGGTTMGGGDSITGSDGCGGAKKATNLTMYNINK